MACTAGKKWFYLIILAFIMLTVPVSLVFSIRDLRGKPLFFVSLNTDKLLSNGFFSSIGYVGDWLTENATTIRKAPRFSSSLLYNESLRVFISIGLFIAAVYYAKSCILVIKNDNAFIMTYNIPLKLRI